MSKGKTPLGDVLRWLLRDAKAAGEKSKTLRNGLHVTARTSPDRLRLTRLEGRWEPCDEAEEEGRICAEHLGWKQPYLEWRTGKSGQHYLIVTNTGLDLGDV